MNIENNNIFNGTVNVIYNNNRVKGKKTTFTKQFKNNDIIIVSSPIDTEQYGLVKKIIDDKEISCSNNFTYSIQQSIYKSYYYNQGVVNITNGLSKVIGINTLFKRYNKNKYHTAG